MDIEAKTNGTQFGDNIFKYISLKENVCILIKCLFLMI